MDSEGQKQPQSQPQERRLGAAPGATLAAQREAMGLSVEQIADQLKLAPRQVVALEQGDFASLPNMAVTRGFIRAYAKVVRLDPAPLVAQIEVTPSVTPSEHTPIRREKITTTFSQSRFPTLASRQSKTKVWIVGGLVALAVIAGAGAWQAGLISPSALRKPVAGPAGTAAVNPATPAAPSAAATPGTAATTAGTPLLSPNVPLVSTPGQAPVSPENTAPLVTTPAPSATATPAATPAVPAPAGTAATPVPAAAAAQGANTLTLAFTSDSWVEIRRPGAAPLISRLVKAGSTETFEIDRQSTLIVGKPEGVQATLRGQPLALPRVANGTISRVQIK